MKSVYGKGMTKNELGKLNYNVYKTFALFREENKTVTPWEDLTDQEQGIWIAAAVEVHDAKLDPEVSVFKKAAELKIGEKIIGPLSWMNGPEQIVDLTLSYDLKMVNVQTMGEYGRYSTEFHEVEAMVEVAL